MVLLLSMLFSEKSYEPGDEKITIRDAINHLIHLQNKVRNDQDKREKVLDLLRYIRDKNILPLLISNKGLRIDGYVGVDFLYDELMSMVEMASRIKMDDKFRDLGLEILQQVRSAENIS